MQIKEAIQFRNLQKVLKTMRKSGITSGQHQEIFLLIASQEGCQQTDILKEVQTPQAGVSKNVQILGAKGFISAHRVGKGTSINLTSQGRILRDTIRTYL